MATLTRISGGNISSKVDCLELENVRIYRIADIDDIAWPARALFSQLTDEEMLKAEPLLPLGAVNAARSEIRLSFNSFLIEAPSFVALIDAGIGNGKQRLDRPAWHCRSGTFLSDLEILGFPADRIDLVVNTHLHADHVGWNTVAEGAAWRPTFRCARYVVPMDELEHWLALDREAAAGTILHGAFADSVQPLLDAGVLDAVPVPSEIGPGLIFEPAPGHSPGMAVVRLTLGKRSVLFLADVIHHPLQFAMPELGSNFCADSEQARCTRDRILADSCDGSTILAPYHFASPAFGCLSKEYSGFRFSHLRQHGSVQDHLNSQDRFQGLGEGLRHE
jgi:glyoxylase-like metal-dependent hydrolase (beta-lactamase superfamily II)